MEEKREGSRSLSQQEEDALQSIARSDLGGLFKARMDEGFTLLYANDSYYAIHGYTRGQLEQEMHGQAVGLVHPEDVAWVSEHLRRALAENQGTVSFEYRIVRRDGAVVWLLISAGLSQEDGGIHNAPVFETAGYTDKNRNQILQNTDSFSYLQQWNTQ